MKNRLFTFSTLLLGSVYFNAQVGINTTSPQATFDVAASPDDTSKLDGIIAPRITGDKLRNKNYTSSQTGALVFVTAADSAPAAQTSDVLTKGYYYFDGTKWTAISTVDWSPKGNEGTSPSTSTLGSDIVSGHYFGTTDSKNIVIATGKNVKGILDVGGTLRGGNSNDGSVPNRPFASFSWGTNNTLVDSNSSNIILGRNNSVSSQGANFPGLAIGMLNIVTNGAKAVGNRNTVNGSNQFVIGNGNSAVQGSATGIALGNDNTFSGFVLGTGNTVTTSNYAFGNVNKVTATGGSSMAIGFGANITKGHQTVYANDFHVFYGKGNLESAVVGFNMDPTVDLQSGAALQIKGVNRPANSGCGPADAGAIRYNTSLNAHEGCNGTSWKAFY